MSVELPNGLDPLTPDDVERRRLELQLEPHLLTWKRIEQAVARATNGSAPEQAGLAHEIRDALRLVPEEDVRGCLAREAQKLAEPLGIEFRASEALRELKREEQLAKSASEQERRRPGEAVRLEDPEPWPEAVEGQDLLEEIVRTFARFLALPRGAATALGLWVFHAHLHDCFEVSPILAITSPEKRCGKTSLLEVLAALVPRALRTANITVAPVFRAIQKVHPTLLIDEGDTFLTRNDELRGVLNSGHTRAGAVVIRTVGDDYDVRIFTTWCPKAIALIGRLPGTLEDRSVVIPMRRRRPDDQIERLRLDRLNAEVQSVQREAARWAIDHAEALESADPQVPDELGDREADNWRPLLAIADAVGGLWPARARRAALALSRPDDDQSPATQLLVDLDKLFTARNTDKLFSADIAEALAGLEDRPWPEWGRQKKPITPTGIAKLLKPFGIRPKSVRVSDETGKGYRLEDFADAFARYLSRGQTVTPSQPSESARARDSQAVTTETDVSAADSREGARDKDCDGVTVVQGPAGGVTREQIIETLDLVPMGGDNAEARADRDARLRALGPGWN